MIENGAEPLPFVGSASLDTPIKQLAEQIRTALHWDEAFSESGNKENFIYALSDRAERMGVLVMRGSYADRATQHGIPVEELRGLAIADPFAPLIFINTADSKSAQIFTFAHEMVHLWIGQSALSDLDLLADCEPKVEHYCNRVAAEMVLPKDAVLEYWELQREMKENCEILAGQYRISKFVVLKRAYDLKLIDRDTYRDMYDVLMQEWEQLKTLKKNSGGNFYYTKPAKESKRFSEAVVKAAMEGKLLYRDAMDLLNIKNMRTFKRFAAELGVA